ncbi:MAG TPA: ATP-binding protein [Stellaceae bacterium]|nr:ATP-binding protein [Stellaceae bacterium]
MPLTARSSLPPVPAAGMAAVGAGPAAAEAGAGGLLARFSIRTRIILLAGTLLAVLVSTTFYLSRQLSKNTAGVVEAGNLLTTIEEANSAQLAFGEMRYWMTDLAVSLLTLSETNAKTARARMEGYLDQLAQRKPVRIEAVRSELALYEDLAHRAVEEYTDDRRVIGNSLLAQARLHSIKVDQLLASIVAETTAEAAAARDKVVAEAAVATRFAQFVVAAAVLFGVVFAFFVVGSIAWPLRRLVVAMDGLNAGDIAVDIPPPGPHETGAMAKTLAAFRDTLRDLRQTLAQLEALRGVGRAVGSTLDFESVLNMVIAQAVEFSHAAAGVMFTYDEDREEFRFHASQGIDADFAEQLKATRIHAPPSTVSTVEVPDLSRIDAAAPRLWSLLAAVGYRALLGAPLYYEGRIIGGLVVLRRETGEFTQEIVTLIEAFAAQSALAVRNAKLFDEQRQRERELRQAHDDLQAAQANLIQAEKMASLGQLTAGIAHEIKNPLNFVNNFAQLSIELLDELKQTAAPALSGLGEEARADLDETIEMLTGNLDKIGEHGRRADGIVKSMLAHSRGGSGERQPTDLNALVEDALNLAYHGARAQDQNFNITLERDLGSGIARVDLVPRDMTRVLLNLIGNGFYAATKRRHDGAEPDFCPTLKVATHDLGDAVEIRVRDNGGGIPPEIKDKLFQPFFTTKPTGEGTGLGLSISYDIITQQHGGTIAVDSDVGEFTEFTIRLPRSQRPAITEAAS